MAAKVEKTITFGGINNQHDPVKVGVDDLVIAANVDLMDDGSIQMRDGYSSVFTGNNNHSIWSNHDNSLCYYVDNTGLNLLAGGNAGVLKAVLPSSARVCYEEINDILAIASNANLVFFDHSDLVTFTLTPVLDGEEQFKALTSTWTGIRCLGYFNGHLLAGTANGVLVSDQYAVGQYDRRDFLLPTDFSVEKISVVEDGIWLCGTSKVVFLSGESIDELIWHEIIDIGIQSIAPIRRDEIKGNESAKPEFIVLADTGVFILGDSGSMTNLTDDKYRPPKTAATDYPSAIRDGIVRVINGTKQFLSTIEYTAEVQHMYVNKAGLYPSTGTDLDVSGTGSQADVTAVAVNIKNGNVSEYTNYEFQGIIECGNGLRGLKEKAIYNMEAADDIGTAINSTVLTGVTDFPDEGQYGAANDGAVEKVITDVYLASRVFVECGSILIRIAEITERTYPNAATSITGRGIENHRYKIGKGLKGRFWQLGYANVSGSDFEVSSIFVKGSRLKRRIGG